MFANRFTALLDACVLAPALHRNILLTLAEAEFFRPRWSPRILEETQRAIEKMQAPKMDAKQRAQQAVTNIITAFEEGDTGEVNLIEDTFPKLPDENDSHVLAAAIKARADVLATDNIKDFPEEIVGTYNIEVKSADDFIADTINLDPHIAANSLRKMRERFKKPAMTGDDLMNIMDARGLVRSVEQLQTVKEFL